MAKSNGTGSSRAKGVALAIEMLRELEAADLSGRSACSLIPTDREPGTPQRNIVLTYLEAARGNREMEAGFTAVISDFVSYCKSGCIPDAAVYDYRLAAGSAA